MAFQVELFQTVKINNDKPDKRFEINMKLQWGSRLVLLYSIAITFHNAGMFVAQGNVLFCIICNECCSLIKINWYCDVKILLVLKFFPQILEKRHISILLLHFWWTTIKGFCRYNFSQLQHPHRWKRMISWIPFFSKTYFPI